MTGGWAPIALLVGLATACATVFGGGIALRFRSNLEPLLAFSSGAVLGVALFDLLPEALRLAGPSQPPLAVTAASGLGFASCLAADRIGSALTAGAPSRTVQFGPALLTAHSLVDGLAIGLAFHVSTVAGLMVALAVLAHDLLDGANTVALSLAGGGRPAQARRWLALDAAAPLLGLAIAHFMIVPTGVLARLLGLFAGVFVYIATVDLLPRGRSTKAVQPVVLITVGLSLIYAIMRFVS